MQSHYILKPVDMTGDITCIWSCKSEEVTLCDHRGETKEIVTITKSAVVGNPIIYSYTL